MPAWLLALLLAALVFYTDDYVIAGVLPEIAAGLDVTEGQAGQLVTAFSVTVALAAPVAGIVLAKLERRRLFVTALGVFVAANLLAALTPSFAVLMVLRVVAALAAAASTPSLFAVAAAYAPEGRTGRYIAVVSLGVTGAIAAGVPVGTWIGGALGWRATFVTMAALGAVAALALAATLQRAPGGEAPPPLRVQLRVLASLPVSLGLLANTFLMTGSMMLLTYLAPFVIDIAAADVGTRGTLFALSGVAGMVGIWAGGRATDAWGANRTFLVGIGVFMATMIGFTVLWPYRPVSVWIIGVIGAAWGTAAFWNSPAIQARLHALAGPVAPQALALNTSATYLGVAIGGAIGGVLLTAAGPGILPAASGAFGLVALLTLGLAVRLTPSRQHAVR